jgi:hypothetical protein
MHDQWQVNPLFVAAGNGDFPPEGGLAGHRRCQLGW